MTIQWKGIQWTLRDGGMGSPGFGSWSAANVLLNPDGTVTLKLTNPTGTQPIGCEMIGDRSLGYGTYSITIQGRMDDLDKNVVLGNLFPFYYGTPYVEFDTGEVSKWEGNITLVSHTSYITETNNLEHDAPIDSSLSHKFVFKWEPGKATYDTYTADGTLILHTEHLMNFAVPGNERPHINLWAFSSGVPTADDLDCPGATFILSDFAFVPLGLVPAPSPDLNKIASDLIAELDSQKKLNAIKTEVYSADTSLTKVNNIKKIV